MTQENAITIDLQLGNSSIKATEKKATDTMRGLQYLANNLETALNNGFAPDAVKAALSVWEDIQEAFGTAWKWFQETLLDPLVNGIIGFINGMIGGIVDGINLVVGMLNKLKFEIPDWEPVLGGMTFGFDIPLLNAPQIPYLAQGAVLPANRPFLAMVGDQRHGTNIEAPLATIQEAVAQVMNDYAARNAAGQQATVEMLRNILEAVLGIQIGDDVIGRAAVRYNRKMAIARGGN